MTDTKALERLLDQLTVGPKKRQWIYMYIGSKAERSFWYTVEKEQPIPCDFDALVGWVEMIDFEERKYKGKPNLKLKLVINAGRIYHIQTGADTVFAKNLYAAIAGASVDQLTRPLDLSPYPGDEETVFVKVSSNGQKLRTARENLPDWKTGDWTQLRMDAQAKVEEAMKLRGLPSRIRRYGDDSYGSQATSSSPRPAPAQAPAGDGDSWNRLKYVKGRLNSANETIMQAITDANEALARKPIKEAVLGLNRKECSTVICTLLWWHGLKFTSEDALTPLYNDMFVSLEEPDEQEGISKFIAGLATAQQAAEASPAMDDIPF